MPQLPKVYYAAKKAIKSHATGGNVLIAATVLAFIMANIPSVSEYYNAFWQQPMRLQIGDFNLLSHGGHPMSVLQFINDALMVVFFFTIGLEIKREVLVGELSSIKKALLPIIAACGGMIVPVAIFYVISGGAEFSKGAAIPMATDIAFSLGVLAMLGKQVPISLKVFLTTLAVVDDIGGIIVIAVCYTTHIEYMMLVYAALLLGVLSLGSVFKIQSKMFYVSIGAVVWFLFLNSGIHSTIAGVLVAFCIPAKPVFPVKEYIKTIRKTISKFKGRDDEKLDDGVILSADQVDSLKQIESASDKVISPLQELEDTLQPVVNYIIIPLFAFANAGVYLLDLDFASIFRGISLAVICGLFVGKFVGIFLFSWLAIKFGLAPMPHNSNWKMLGAIAILGGIGFTVSVFIANLSFADGANDAIYLSNAKLGIIIGSLFSGVVGYFMLSRVLPREEQIQTIKE